MISSFQKKLDKSKKHPSIRDMLGRNVVNSLPENFFEKLVDLENKIEREFTMDLLQELINTYSTAIEYYESIEDPKYMNFTNKLNSLLSKPQILKKMTDISKHSIILI